MEATQSELRYNSYETDAIVEQIFEKQLWFPIFLYLCTLILSLIPRGDTSEGVLGAA